MPDKDGQGEDGVDWLASQLGGGAKPATPDEFLPRKGAPRRPKANAAEPAPPGDVAPKTAGFLWGLKPTTETDPRVASTDFPAPAGHSATPAAPAPTPTAAAPVPAVHPAMPVAPASASVSAAEPEPLVPATPVRLDAPAFPAAAAPELAAVTPPVAAVSASRSQIDLEPAPWWTTPAQSPLVLTVEEAAAAAELHAGEHPASAVAPPPVPDLVRAPAARRFRARAAEPAPLAAENSEAPAAATAVFALPPVVTPGPADASDATVSLPVPAESSAPADSTRADGTLTGVQPAASPSAATLSGAILAGATVSGDVPPETRQSRRRANANANANADGQTPLPMPGSEPAAASAATAATPETPATPVRRRSAGGRPPAGPRKPGALPPRLLWIAGGLLALIVLVGLFFLGRQLVGGPSSPVAVATTSAAPTPTPTPTAIPEPTGPQPVGVHKWNTLFGGECLQPYLSPWEEDFTVADCAAPHAAQLVYRGAFPGDAAAAFPGEEALAAQINLLCSASGVIDLPAAAEFPDVQVQGSYPVTAEQWAKTPHSYYCFVNRASGEPLTRSLAGPGPAPAG